MAATFKFPSIVSVESQSQLRIMQHIIATQDGLRHLYNQLAIRSVPFALATDPDQSMAILVAIDTPLNRQLFESRLPDGIASDGIHGTYRQPRGGIDSTCSTYCEPPYSVHRTQSTFCEPPGSTDRTQSTRGLRSITPDIRFNGGGMSNAARSSHELKGLASSNCRKLRLRKQKRVQGHRHRQRLQQKRGPVLAQQGPPSFRKDCGYDADSELTPEPPSRLPACTTSNTVVTKLANEYCCRCSPRSDAESNL